MIDIQENKNPEILEVEIAETITRADMKHLLPVVEKHVTETTNPRLLLLLEEFNGWDSISTLWDELKMGKDYAKQFERIALVGDSPWQKWMMKIRVKVSPYNIKFFDPAEINHARNWLR